MPLQNSTDIPLSPLYPFEAKTFHRNDLAMRYLDEGNGEPIVMVHGNPTWSFYYRDVVLALRNRFRCIVPDHIGCGQSDKPDTSRYDYALKSRIDDLEALLEHLGIDNGVTLLVHDWGGMIGMGYAQRHPDRIKRLIISNTAAFHQPLEKRLPLSLKLGRNTALGKWLILKQNAFCKAATKWCVTRKPLPEDVKAMYLAPYNTPENRIAVLKFVQTIPLSPSDTGYEIVTDIALSLQQFQQTPTLLLWGQRDFVFDIHYFHEWQKRMPNAESQVWADCGHYLLEDAGDEVIARITRFLQEQP